MKYTIVKQVIGEVDIMPCVDIKHCIHTIDEILEDMRKEGVGCERHYVHQERWGGTLIFEIHAEDGCIYSVFENEITD